MEIMLDTSQKAINWSAKGVERITQNIVNLINTNRYEIAYDRTNGLSGKFIDKPLQQAIPEAIAEIHQLITEREPRASVKDITFSGTDDSGNLTFKVVIVV